MTSATAVAAHAAAGPSPSGMSTMDLTDGLTATDLAGSLVGTGVTLVSASYTGSPLSAGTFTGGATPVGFGSGVVLSSGEVDLALGPNDDEGTTGANDPQPGDADLDAIVGETTYDASVLELVLTPSTDELRFRYVFGSEEYLEFVDSFNDVFAFYANGVNCAVVDDGAGGTVPVSINTINDVDNAALYRDNPAGSGTIDIQADGLTVVLDCVAAVTPNEQNTLKLAIADAGDTVLDSWVFIEAGSITSGATGTVTTYTGDTSGQYSDPVTLSATVTEDDGTTPVVGATVGFAVGPQTTTAVTDASGVASTSLVLDQMAGMTSVVTSYAGGGELTGSSDTDPFEVLLEDCTLTSTTPASAAPGSVTLSAELAELDASVGDLSGRTVGFTATDAALTETTGNGVTDAAGVATTMVDLSPGMYTVEAAFAGDGHYAPCVATPTELDLVVVGEDALVTGGGVIGDETGHVTLGFVAEWFEGHLHGQLQVNDHRDPGHRFHGYEVTELQVVGNTATWTGVGRLDGVDGYTFEAIIEDHRNGRQGARKGTTNADHVTITVRDGAGAVVWSVDADLASGNVKVHG